MLSVISPLNSILKTTAFLLCFSTVCANTTSNFNQTGEQISYFKSPTSRYSSGETNLYRLTQTQVQNINSQKINIENSFYFYKNQKISTQLLKTTTARDLSKSESLRDLGFYLTLKKTAFKLTADEKSKTIFMISQKNKFQPLGYSNGFVLTKINHIKGYVNILDCISKFDFAKAVYAQHPTKNLKQWFYVKTKYPDHVETVDGQTIYLNNVEGLFQDSTKAIITTTNQMLPLGTALEIKTESATNIWYQSKLPGHGIVYWQKKSSDFKKENKKIKIDELLKKEIAFVSFNPKNPRQALVSAKGLYMTLDGENWIEIEQFKDYSGPVLFYNEFLIFAGNYKSIDGGATFENYIQIEKLSAAISGTMGFDPKRLQVKKIKTISPFKLEVDLDIGSRVIKVQTPVYAQDWKVVKI